LVWENVGFIRHSLGEYILGVGDAHLRGGSKFKGSGGKATLKRGSSNRGESVSRKRKKKRISEKKLSSKWCPGVQRRKA